MHGYMGIILSVPTYTTLSPTTSFNVPVHPGTLTVDAGATQYEIALAKTKHEDAIQNFQSYQLVQRALIQQVLEAAKSRYLNSLRNRIIGQVSSDIRNLILYPFSVYER